MPREAIIALVTIWTATACVAPAAPAEFSQSACAPWLAEADARCGHVRVPENYEVPGGRQIDLNVIILPARTDDGLRDAHFELDGGPGLAATDAAEFYVGPGAAYRERRDLVFVDMRGTGASNPLRCAAIEELEQTDPWAPMYPPDLVAQCAAELSSVADLSQYTTRNAAQDLESVRLALGYDQISFVALSYGTSLALTYMASHPQHVQASVLIGTAPPDSAAPRDHAANAARALTDVLSACRADPVCHATYPDPAKELSRIQGELESERAEIFAEWLRNRMYTPANSRMLPKLLRTAAQEGPSAVVKAERSMRSFADGLYLSMTCGENLPYIDLAAASAAARATLFGDYRLRRQAAACAQWPVTPSAPAVLDGAMTPAVLFVSGEHDPVTPPEWADRIVAHFPNSRHIVLPESGHIFDGMSGVEDCLDPLIMKFLDSGDASGLEAGCVADMRPPPFATDG